MAVPKSQRGRSMADQLLAEFGVNSTSWTRLRFVYNRHLLGDERATHLVEQIESGILTPAKAERLLREALDDTDLVGDMSNVKVADLFREVLHFDSYISIVGAALRRGVRLNQRGISDEEVAELVALAQRVGAKTTKMADLLALALTGGSTADGR